MKSIIQAKAPAYSPVEGDHIDELFAEHMNKQPCNLELVRLEAGKYMFGTKKITAVGKNDKLLIQVGGGFMSVDEYIQRHGEVEQAKVQRSSFRAGPKIPELQIETKPKEGFEQLVGYEYI